MDQELTSLIDLHSRNHHTQDEPSFHIRKKSNLAFVEILQT